MLVSTINGYFYILQHRKRTLKRHYSPYSTCQVSRYYSTKIQRKTIAGQFKILMSICKKRDFLTKKKMYKNTVCLVFNLFFFVISNFGHISCLIFLFITFCGNLSSVFSYHLRYNISKIIFINSCHFCYSLCQ